MASSVKSFGRPLWQMGMSMPVAEARHIARTQLLDSSYHGASASRRQLSAWSVSSGDADADTLNDLPNLRFRSRDHVRNNPLAAGVINTNCTSIVGTGLKPQSQIDHEFLGLTAEQAKEWQKQAEREFWLAAGSREFDVGRKLNFLAQQDLVLRSTLENGDCFAQRAYIVRPGSPYATKFQLIEADRCSNEHDHIDTDTLAGGVERDPATGAVVRYHFKTKHPGSATAFEFRWTKVDAFDPQGRPNVLHVYKPLRIDQTRGIPYLAPVIETFKQIGRYTEAEIMAAVISGMFTVFVKSSDGQANLQSMLGDQEASGATKTPVTEDNLRMGNGAVIGLAEGEDIETANPGRPNTAFEPFVQAILRQVGVALEIPFELLVKHFTASYSAARAALLEAWRYFLTMRSWMVRVYCQPVYEAIIEEAVARGRLKAPGFLRDPGIRHAYLRTAWNGPSMGQIDPLKESKAARERIDMRLTTLTEESVAHNGADWESKVPQLEYEQGVIEKLTPEPAADDPEADRLMDNDD